MANAANKTQIKKAEDQAKYDRLTDKQVLTNLMQHPMGRRWIWVQLSECHVFQQTFDPGPGGNARMCFAEGQRSRGLKLLDSVQRYAPVSFTTMLEENNPSVRLTEEENDAPD